MTDSFLPRWLGHQTERAVGRIDLHTIRSGLESLREARKILESEGVVYHVTDALEQGDIDLTVQAYGSVPAHGTEQTQGETAFLSGGSGISQAFGNLYFADAEPKDFTEKLRDRAPGLVVISGSESPTAKGQLDHAVKQGFSSVTAHPLDILKDSPSPKEEPSSSAELAVGELVSEKAKEISGHYRAGRSVVLSLEKKWGRGGAGKRGSGKARPLPRGCGKHDR